MFVILNSSLLITFTCILQSIKAFVSWIRSYNEHQASFIFQLKQVDMVSVCLSFGLLTLPKVPELRSLDLTSFTPATDISVSFAFYP